MLVLSREFNESVIITASNGEKITLTVVAVRGNRVRLGFEAPKEVTIHRKEIQDQVDVKDSSQR